jgi:hypothetical protein
MQTTVFNVDKIGNTIIQNFNHEALSMFHKLANEKLDEQIAIGNNKYATYIDNRPAGGRADVQRALKRVRFNFIESSLRLAIRIIEDQLYSAIRETTIMRSGRLSHNIRAFYAPKGGAWREVTNIKDIEFNQGDVLAIVPATPYAAVVNTMISKRISNRKTARYGLSRRGKARRGLGFMALAATKTRSIIGQQRFGAGLSIKAVFSMSLVPMVNYGQVNPKLIGRGIPAIMIEYQFMQRANVS